MASHSLLCYERALRTLLVCCRFVVAIGPAPFGHHPSSIPCLLDRPLRVLARARRPDSAVTLSLWKEYYKSANRELVAPHDYGADRKLDSKTSVTTGNIR